MLVDTLTRLKITNQTVRSTKADSKSKLPWLGTESLPCLKAGRELGPYRLLEWLGRGAEGDVWKAVRLHTAQEVVALKVLKPSLASNPARMAQFRREAERGTGLVGPSLLRVHELNQVDGYNFMILTYVESTSLRDVIRRRHDYLSRGDVEQGHPFVNMREEDYLASMTRTLAKAARALASVHEQRIAHRDVKPANILMDNRRREAVYLCDFGLGRDLDVATSQQMRDGAGTPMYMAPERLLRLTADEIKCDIYSMGVTLCEALTLRRPFRVPDDLPFPALTMFLAKAEPIHPCVLDPEFPETLAAIITRAMARDPGGRHDSVRELAGDLDRFVSELPSRGAASLVRQEPGLSPARASIRYDRVGPDASPVRRPRRDSAIRSDDGKNVDAIADPFSDDRAD